MDKRLRTTLIAVAACVGILFTLFSLLSIHSANKALKEAITGKCVNETVKSANHMSTILENAEGAIDALTATASSTFDLDSFDSSPLSYAKEYMDQFNPILKNTLQNLNDTASLFFTFNADLVQHQEDYEIRYSYDNRGDIISLSQSRKHTTKEADAKCKEYYIQAVANPGRMIWTGPIYKQNILTCSKAVFVGDVLIGVIGIDINTRNTTDMIMSIEVESKSNIALFNQSGKAIVDSFRSRDQALHNILTELLEDKHSPMRKNAYGSMEKTVNGKKHLLTYAQLSNGWILTIIKVQEVIFAPITLLTHLIIVLTILLIILLVILLYFILKRHNMPYEEAIHLLKIMELESDITPKERKEIENENDIRRLVKKQIETQRNKDIMMTHQSRFAQTGRMVTHIAHQWKQPLNTINLILGNLLDDYLHGEMTRETMQSAVEKTQHLTRVMSDAIDSFNKYLKPEDEPSCFTVDAVISAVVSLATDLLKKNKITFSFQKKEELKAYGYPNALYHVILNVLSNAIDASNTVPAEQRYISITSSQQGDWIIINIFNRGTPLSESLRKQIFTPYFTTKGSKGTGLGLPISKNILENAMNGSISLDNVRDGVQCTIQIAKGDKTHD